MPPPIPRWFRRLRRTKLLLSLRCDNSLHPVFIVDRLKRIVGRRRPTFSVYSLGPFRSIRRLILAAPRLLITTKPTRPRPIERRLTTSAKRQHRQNQQRQTETARASNENSSRLLLCAA